MHETPPHHYSQSWPIVFLACLIALSACTRERVNGSANPPESFGQVERNFLGCPDISGLYAWPPAQGETRSVSLTGERFRNGGSLEPIRMSLFNEAQIWVSGATNGHALILRTRNANTALIARGEQLSKNWDYRAISRLSLSCSGAWISLEGATIIDDKPDKANRRESSSDGLRMARLKDGSLALGQWVRYSGRRQSIDIFGAELANFPAGDLVSWNWARLARVGDNGKDASTTGKPAPLQ